MTKLYVDLDSGTYYTEKPVVVEVDDEQLENFCEKSDSGRVRLIMSALDHGPRRQENSESWFIKIDKKGKIV